MLILILIEFEIIYMTCFLLVTFLCNVTSLSLLYSYFHSKSSEELYSLVPPFQTVSIRIHHVTSIGSKHDYFSRVLNVMKFHISLCETDPCMCASINPFILTSPRQSVILAYPPNLQFLALPSLFISQTSLIVSILTVTRVTQEPYIR